MITPLINVRRIAIKAVRSVHKDSRINTEIIRNCKDSLFLLWGYKRGYKADRGVDLALFFNGLKIPGLLSYESKGRGFESRRAHQRGDFERGLLFLMFQGASGFLVGSGSIWHMTSLDRSQRYFFPFSSILFELWGYKTRGNCQKLVK